MFDKFDLILLFIFCPQHGKRTWHLMGIDGVCRCLECRLEAVTDLIHDIRQEIPQP